MEIMNIKQAAEFLCVHPNTLRKWVREGKVPGSKIGSKWTFVKADLLEVIRDYRVLPVNG